MMKEVKKLFLCLGGALLCCLSTASGSYALQFEFGDNLTLDWDTTMRYTVASRLLDPDGQLIANPNGDDGNRNFDQYSLVKNRFDVITEGDLNFGEVGSFYSLGVFARARAWYDFAYNQNNDHNSPLTNNSVSVPFDEFTNDTEKWHGKKAEMLDYFLYSSFDIAGRSASVRLGQQAVNWGETLFLVGGVMSSQGPIDATGFNQPGAELKELFLPVEQVTAQVDLTDTLSIEGYYQWEWEPHRLDAAGSYFSTSDILDEGGESFILVPGAFAAQRVVDEDANDSGQWGVALRYLAENLFSTEFGLYYINYHDQLPMVVAGDFVDLTGDGIPDGPSTYHLKYAENIHLLAASFGTVIGDTNVSGEVAYRENVPVQVVGALPTYKEAEVIHYSLSCIHLFGPNPFTDKLNLSAEVGADQVIGMDKDELFSDKFAWGFSFTLKPTWQSVLPSLDISVPISLAMGIDGDSALGASFVEDKHKMGITFDFEYRTKYMFQVGYVNFFGGNDSNVQNDRDYISMNFKYSF
ncbi:Protein of unknown function [Desulfocicer vacuolatum DSM 3385]|uniref:DUF1302 domain-containing protein n=1 Tax=Desulfocicer vacuolatum DSM 3385 TaxID=1121400 RepID=A0A1W2D5S7_9BACT|nr:DUF1302 domain-containing protein [Desulfocicer vacuolatum]SMC92556.1 Protein of unknown function [Desulfocicer vacuolatum DSM 3385]